MSSLDKNLRKTDETEEESDSDRAQGAHRPSILESITGRLSSLLTYTADDDAAIESAGGRARGRASTTAEVLSEAAELMSSADEDAQEDLGGGASAEPPPPKVSSEEAVGGTAHKLAAVDHSPTAKSDLLGLLGGWIPGGPSQQAIADDGGQHADPGTVSLEALLEHMQEPFEPLLVEVSKQGEEAAAAAAAAGAAPAFLALARRAKQQVGAAHVDAEAQTPEEAAAGKAAAPLLFALMRARLISHVLGCHEAIAAELSEEEVLVLDAFVVADLQLEATVPVPSLTAEAMTKELPLPEDHQERFLRRLAGEASGEGTVEFVDVLRVFTEERTAAQGWTIRNTIRYSLSGLSGLLGGDAPALPSTSRRSHRIAELRGRCAHLPSVRLAHTTAAYQRMLVQLHRYRCESTLKDCVARGLAHAAQEGTSGFVGVLLTLLRCIYDELTPTERVLWELVGVNNASFDGQLTKEDVTSAIAELTSHARARESARGADADEPIAEMQELQQLREESQRAAIDSLFVTASGDVREFVTLATVLAWWWDLPQDFRVASALLVPPWLLRRTVDWYPQDMFRVPLRRLLANAVAARDALHGYTKVFAELRALVVQRRVESLHSRTPTGTQATESRSEAEGQDHLSDLMEGDGDSHGEAEEATRRSTSNVLRAAEEQLQLLSVHRREDESF